MKVWFLVSLACLVVITAGCESDDDSADGRSYLPPAGLGAILVENDTEYEMTLTSMYSR